jgi:hypothetical protein
MRIRLNARCSAPRCATKVFYFGDFIDPAFVDRTHTAARVGMEPKVRTEAGLSRKIRGTVSNLTRLAPPAPGRPDADGWKKTSRPSMGRDDPVDGSFSSQGD